MRKEEIRKRLLTRRESQHVALKLKRDRAILRRLERFSVFKNCREFFTYLTHRGEVDTGLLIKKYFGKKRIVVPKMKRSGIRLCELRHPEHFERGKFGVREPAMSSPFHASAQREREQGEKSGFAGFEPKRALSIACALIPGIAFDKTGHRIGFGGGHFDRLLKKIHATTIALAYEFQIIDKVPARGYDVAVDYIVTERRVIKCNVIPADAGIYRSPPSRG